MNSEKPIEEKLASLKSTMECDASLAGYSIFTPTATEKMGMKEIVLNFKDSKYAKNQVVDRAIGSLMAMEMGDSIGSQNEGMKVSYDSVLFKDFDESSFTTRGMKAGNYTDDSAMAHCLADTLIKKGKMDCIDFLQRASLWFFCGYNNGTGLATGVGKKSHGIGHTTRDSLKNFVDSKFTQLETSIKRKASNGGVMRLAPVPLFFYDNLSMAIEASVAQSKTTHAFSECSDAARIMCYSIVKAVNNEIPYEGQENFAKNFLDSLKSFPDLSLETEEGKLMVNAEKNWNWKNEKFHFPLEAGGFLATEAVAMALHCAYSTQNPTSAILKAVNLNGDSDTVGAITGQIVGAIYGISAFPPKWSQYILNWDRNGETALKALLLVNKSK